MPEHFLGDADMMADPQMNEDRMAQEDVVRRNMDRMAAQRIADETLAENRYTSRARVFCIINDMMHRAILWHRRNASAYCHVSHAALWSEPCTSAC